MVTCTRKDLEPALPTEQRHGIPAPGPGTGAEGRRETVRMLIAALVGKGVVSSTGLKCSALWSESQLVSEVLYICIIKDQIQV